MSATSPAEYETEQDGKRVYRPDWLLREWWQYVL